MVNVPRCRSHLLFKGVFILDYNLCLACATEISEKENEGFHSKMICFYFGYCSNTSGDTARNIFNISDLAKVSGGLITVKVFFFHVSSIIFKPLTNRLPLPASMHCARAGFCMNK